MTNIKIEQIRKIILESGSTYTQRSKRLGYSASYLRQVYNGHCEITDNFYYNIRKKERELENTDCV